MDTARATDDSQVASDPGRATGDDAALGIGVDERRMHVRAYNHWVSLLGGRAYPSIEDLDPSGIVDFGAHSVLLDFSAGIEDPAIRFLGRSLRAECALDASVSRIADVPARSLLSRLTDHYLQIIANRAPIGFEAEFVGTRGHTTLYRGILMPFSSDGDGIDFIYGVINWKEMADAPTQAGLVAELDAAVRAQAQAAPVSDAPVWADGPGAGTPPGCGGVPDADGDVVDDDPVAAEEDAPLPSPAPLADRLSIARESAAAARGADTRSRAALYRALGRAHDFAIAAGAEPEAYSILLAEAGVIRQARAPMTPVVKLVFGTGYDKTRLTEFASVLAAAHEAAIGTGGLGAFLDAHEGGIKGVVQAARDARRAAPRIDRPARAPKGFAAWPTLVSVAFDTDAPPGVPILLVGRATGGGGVEIVGTVGDAGIVRRAVAAIG